MDKDTEAALQRLFAEVSLLRLDVTRLQGWTGYEHPPEEQWITDAVNQMYKDLPPCNRH